VPIEKKSVTKKSAQTSSSLKFINIHFIQFTFLIQLTILLLWMRKIFNVEDESFITDGCPTQSLSMHRTRGQENVNMGIPLDAVSRMMGHSSTKTTEKYYCRKTNDSAILEAQQIYAKMSKAQEIAGCQEPKRPPSEKFSWTTGYA
jgi:hypothetical protein